MENEGNGMNAYRRLRFPILIGAGVIAAGVLLYHSNSRIDTRQTQGAIAQREVYRDAQVSAADVNATPGTAPVAAKVLMESKEYQDLAKNPAFRDLMADASFQVLARNEQFLSLLSNRALADLARNEVFSHYLKSDALSRLMRDLRADMSHADMSQAVHASLVAAHAESLAQNAAFNQMMMNSSFQSFLRADSNQQALRNLISMNSFASLVSNARFQDLASQAAFQNALRQGAAADLSQSLRQATAADLNQGVVKK